jgi:ribosomal protein L7Ae-like RNA K-turn-binding protein
MCKRNTDKLDKYLKSLCKKHNGNFIGLEDGKTSAYYSINGRVIRVSDHIGKNSSGNFHFIITDDGDYLMYYNNTNKVRVVNYNQAKDFCRSFFLLSPMLVELQSNQFKFEYEAIISKNDAKSKIAKLENDKKSLVGSLAKKDEDIKNLKKGITEKETAINAYKRQIEVLSNDIDDTTDLTTIIKMLNRHQVPLSVINKVVNHITNENVTSQTA